MAKKWITRSFGLRTLLGLVTAVAIILASLANHLHSERRQSDLERATAAKLALVSIETYWRPSDSWFCRLIDPRRTERLESIGIDRCHGMGISTDRPIAHRKRCTPHRCVSASGSSPRWRGPEDRGGFELNQNSFDIHLPRVQVFVMMQR